MNTPITDAVFGPQLRGYRAETCRRLELDRAALMKALEAVHRVSAMGSEEEAIAWTALAAARANFPEP